MQPTINPSKNSQLTAKNKFVVYMFVFASSLTTVMVVRKKLALSDLSLFALIMIPALFFTLACIELARSIRGDDELFKKIIADAIQLTFVVLVVSCLLIGLLQTFSVVPAFSLFYVFFAACLMFAFSYAWKTRDYH